MSLENFCCNFRVLRNSSYDLNLKILYFYVILGISIRVYITGGNSRLAKYVLDAIPSAVPLTRKPVEGAIESSYSYEELKYIFKDADVVIHIAGRVHGSYSELYRSNVVLTQTIVDSLPENARLIYASSVSVYGKKPLERPTTESTPTNPDTPYAKTKFIAEEIALSHRNTVSLRIATLYGENFIEYFKLFRLIEKGNAFVFGSGRNKVPFTYAADVANAVKNSIKSNPGVYLLSAPSIEQEKALKKVAVMLGVPFKPRKLGFLRALALSKINSLLTFSSILKEETVHSLSADREFSYLKAKKALGFSPIHPGKGIAKMVRYYIAKYKNKDRGISNKNI